LPTITFGNVCKPETSEFISEFWKLKLDNLAIYRKITHHNPRSRGWMLIVASIVLALNSHSLPASDYLDELATEAEATDSVSKKSQLSPSEQKQLKEMESLLKSEKPSTYKYYEKLRQKNKENAYEAFAKDHSGQDDRLSHLQKKVMDLYFTQ